MTRAILAFLLAALFLALSARAQTHFIGTGEAMEPTLIRGNRITVVQVSLIALREGDIVARLNPREIVATRCHAYQAGRGWITRADAVDHDDSGYLTEDNLVGLAYLDTAPNAPILQISSELTKDAYVLNPVYPLSYEGREQQGSIAGPPDGPPDGPPIYWPPVVETPPIVNDPPVTIDPLFPTGPHTVPEGGPIPLAMTVLALIVMGRCKRA